MIQSNQVWLAIEPVEMRLGIDGLSPRVQQALSPDISQRGRRNRREGALIQVSKPY